MTKQPFIPDLALIAAMDRNGLIGAKGRMPWRIREDLAWFKEVTIGHIVVMGRRTWWSLKGPLPGRENVILTRDMDFTADGALVMHGITEVIDHCGSSRTFIIGGADVFRQFLPLAGFFYQTLIEAEFAGDTWFPGWNPECWDLISSNLVRSFSGLDISFNIYSRTSND